MPDPICVRLPVWSHDILEEHFDRHNLSRSKGMREIVEQWLTLSRYPELEYREGVSGRRVAVRGGPEVWELVSVWRSQGERRETVYEHFAWLDRELIERALECYEWHPEPIDGTLAENARLAARAGVAAGDP